MRWKRNRKNNGSSITVTSAVEPEVLKYLDELGNPFGLFIGYGHRLYLMDNYKGDKDEVIQKINGLYLKEEINDDRIMSEWFPTKKKNGWSYPLETLFVIKETKKYLNKLGNPFGLFIGTDFFGQRAYLYLMKNFRGNKKDVVEKLKDIYEENDILRIQEKMMNNLSDEVQKILDERNLPYTEENVHTVVEEILRK